MGELGLLKFIIKNDNCHGCCCCYSCSAFCGALSRSDILLSHHPSHRKIEKAVAVSGMSSGVPEENSGKDAGNISPIAEVGTH